MDWTVGTKVRNDETDAVGEVAGIARIEGDSRPYFEIVDNLRLVSRSTQQELELVGWKAVQDSSEEV